MTIKTEFRRQFDNTDTMDLLVGQFVVGVSEQHIPSATLQMRDLTLNLYRWTRLDNFIDIL